MCRFTIITVTYNANKALKKTTKSIQDQTYRNFEHVVIDGGSKDGSLKYLRSLSFQNLHYISEIDKGIYDAMNKGIQQASGEYLLFLNAGDNFTSRILLEKVAIKIKKLDKKPRIIYGGANVYSENGKFVATLNPLEFSKDNLNKYATRTVCHQSIFVHKDGIVKYNDQYTFKGELNWYYDLLNINNRNKILNIDEIICDYYLGGIGDKNFWKNFLERMQVSKEQNSLFKFITLMPFFLIPLIFRVRRIVFGR